jgi:lipid II:glycine glycyltransferase (peptidoglycan interpeptide bridge formation enzyme)
MDIRIKDLSVNELYQSSVLQQTRFWSLVKARQGIASRVFELSVRKSDGSLDKETLLLLHRRLSDDVSVAYVPYGPEILPEQEEEGILLEELSEGLRSHLPETCAFLRFDLKWESPWARDSDFFDPEGNWLGPPKKKSQELRINFATRNWNLRKANTNILPTNTIFLDLRKSKQTLMAEMRPKTRYNIRLAERKGVTVRVGGFDDLPIWNDLYSQTCRRNRLFHHRETHFKDLLGIDRSIFDSNTGVRFLIAQAEKTPLAAMFLVFSGKRATYLYGASASVKRNLMATYALQWRAIQEAKAAGCLEYDLFGVSPSADPSHPLYGLYRFKRGFGGELYHRMGCWDYPLDENDYESCAAAEMNSQGYHLR